MEPSDWKITSLHNSKREGKKMFATFVNLKTGQTRTVHFGAKGYEDYTDHKDKKRRELYRNRHEKDLGPDKATAGYLSFFLLWGESTSLERNLNFYIRNVLRHNYTLNKIDRT